MPIKLSESLQDDSWTHRRGLSDELKCTILAAGLGRRLEPLTTRHLPKPLFPLGGKVPMAEIWIRRFVESGITNISMNLCVLADTIKRYFEDGSKFYANITYVEEETPSGTLGGVCKQALGRDAKVLSGERPLDTEAFLGSTIIAPSGDIVTNFGAELLEEMYDIHKQAGSAFTMVLVPVPWARRKDFGTVVLQNEENRQGIISKAGSVREFIEKDPNSPSNLNNASIYMIEMDLIKELDSLRTEAHLNADRPFYDFGKHVFPAMLNKLPYISLSREYSLWGIQYDGEWFDVGQKRDYLSVNRRLLDGKLRCNLAYKTMPWGYLGTNVTIDLSQVTLIAPVVVGNNCTIEPGVTLGPYAVVGDGWIVERGATIRNSVLWEVYSFFDDTGNEISVDDRVMIDQHKVQFGVTIEDSIVPGGVIQSDLHKKTVEVMEDGQIRVLPIDYVPEGPRA